MLAVHRAFSYFALGTSLLCSAFVACGDSERGKGELPDSSTIASTSTTGTGASGGEGGEGAEGGEGGAGGAGGMAGAGGTGGGDPCGNTVQDGDETDVDCGGSCSGCADGKACANPADCISLSCLVGVCQPAACPDGVKNGTETDLDCGGMGCPQCIQGQACVVDGDCDTQSCEALVCAAPACMDAAKNGDETDVDCGGSCPPCADGKNCILPNDCVSQLCPSGTCLLTTCGNMMVDGSETDLDCGGPACLPCDDFLLCTVNADCKSKKCTAGSCAAPACNDQVANGNETDVDCGGSCPNNCVDGKKCLAGDDCQSSVCASMVCQIPTCMDGVKNAAETSVDCGGNVCSKCGLGAACTSSTDCATLNCTGMPLTCNCPLKMITVALPLGLGAYCIDATEVTNAQYEAFVAIAWTNQLAACGWNPTFVPEANWPQPLKPGFPVTNVDWCDAYNYCVYAGKHLCGKAAGGPNDFLSYADPTQSEWHNACSAQGQNIFPYGDSFVAGSCVDIDPLDTSTIEVQTPPPGSQVKASTCVGGSSGLHHMSGNVREWEQSCDGVTGPNDGCRLRGGGYTSTTELEIQCAGDVAMPRNTAASPQGDDIGFRCCL